MSNILVMISGGADSISALYRLLKDTHHDIWAHHILIDHQPNRMKEEEIATAESVKWLTKNVRRFSFTKNMFTYPMELRVYPSDMYVVGFVAASMAVSFTLKYGTVFSHIVAGHTKSDFEKKPAIIRAEGQRALIEQMFKQQELNLRHVGLPKEYQSKLKLLQTIPKTDWYPNAEFYKTEVVGFLPEQLLGLCWSCLKPTNFMEPCGYCSTCVELEKLNITGIGQTLIKNKSQYIKE